MTQLLILSRIVSEHSPLIHEILLSSLLSQSPLFPLATRFVLKCDCIKGERNHTARRYGISWSLKFTDSEQKMIKDNRKSCESDAVLFQRKF
jgi:hypothetical protein